MHCYDFINKQLSTIAKQKTILWRINYGKHWSPDEIKNPKWGKKEVLVFFIYSNLFLIFFKREE